MWCVPQLDDEYAERMEDVLDSYERAYDPQQPVVCLDERAVQLHGEKRPGSPAKPGKPARFDYEYARRGTANIFCAVEPLAGKHLARVTKSRSGAELVQMLALLARAYPRARTIHLVMDNLNTHSLATVIKHYGERRGRALWSRFTVHYTPKHGSWLNQAEIEIGILNRQCMGRRRFDSLEALDHHVREWSRRVNREKLRFRWRFTTTKARAVFRYSWETAQNQAA